MQVQPINNNINTSFKGKFVKSSDLEHYVKGLNKTEFYEFKAECKAMDKVADWMLYEYKIKKLESGKKLGRIINALTGKELLIDVVGANGYVDITKERNLFQAFFRRHSNLSEVAEWKKLNNDKQKFLDNLMDKKQAKGINQRLNHGDNHETNEAASKDSAKINLQV